MGVSIIIPCYKQAQYLPEAIESALAQTEKCEVIVINDGSPDNTTEVALKYADKGVKLITQVNKGLASARNTGIMNATGEWILPLDADDILNPNCVGELLFKAKQVPDADVIGPSMTTFGLATETVIVHQEVTLEKMRLGNHLGYFSMIRKSVLLEVGGYSPKMIWGAEDYALWFDLLTRGKKIATVQIPLVFYRIKGNSMWSETQKHKKEYMEQIYKDYPTAWPKEMQEELREKNILI